MKKMQAASGEAYAALTLAMIAIGEICINKVSSLEVIREKVDGAMLALERGMPDLPELKRAHEILERLLNDQLTGKQPPPKRKSRS